MPAVVLLLIGVGERECRDAGEDWPHPGVMFHRELESGSKPW